MKRGDQALASAKKRPLTFHYRDGLKALDLTREQLQTRITRAEVYGRTLPRIDLDAFDAHGMDVIEGRA
jgi:hypothetical protein